MFFTRFPINKTRRESRRLLGSPYAMHAAVAGSLPARPDAGRVLWRVDEQEDRSSLLYIVSPVTPSLVGLDEQIGWPDLEPQYATRSYDAFLASIKNGQRYKFRLVANPVVSRSRRGGKGDGKRHAHLTPLQQTAWLIGAQAYTSVGMEPPELFRDPAENRAVRCGFHVMADERYGEPLLTVSDIRTQRFSRGAQGRTITIATARYDGLLEVTDADKLRHALVCGIGHGKGFGCGLLTLVPVEEA